MHPISRIALIAIALGLGGNVIGKPSFTLFPAARTVINPTETLTLSANAVGNGMVSYQWYRNGQVIATTPTLTKRIEGYQDQGPYVLVATDSADGLKTRINAFVNVSYWGQGRAVAPGAPENLIDVVAVAAAQVDKNEPSTRWYMALKGDGTVVKWGYNFANISDVPAEINQYGNIHSIAARTGQAVVLAGFGQVRAWPTALLSGWNLRDNLIYVDGGNTLLAVANDGTALDYRFDRIVNQGNTVYANSAVACSIVACSDYASWTSSAARVEGGAFNTSYDTTRVGYDYIPSLIYSYTVTPGSPMVGNYMITVGQVGSYAGWSFLNGVAPIPTQVSTSPSKAMDIAVSGNTAYALMSGGSLVSWDLNYIEGTGLSLSNVSTSNAEGFIAIRGDYNGAFIALSALIPPEVLAHPMPVIISSGQGLFLEPRIKGNPLTYKWYKNGTLIPFATSSTLTINSAAAGDSGSYSCEATNSLGTAITNAAVVVVNQAPTITTQPQSTTKIAGDSVTFTVVATGNPSPTYQWRKSGAPISGAISSSYTIPTVTPSESGSYSCVITNSIGSVTSTLATLVVNTLPVFSVTPSGMILSPGTNYLLTSTVSGTTPIAYQWVLNGQAITGATGSSYSIIAADFTQEGAYSLRATNPAGTTTSVPALIQLSVTVGSLDSDGDGFSDSLERYFSPLGFNPGTDSSSLIARFKAVIAQIGPYYTADQMRNLALGSPTLQRAGNGNFLLDVTVQESTDLTTWTKRTLSSPVMTTPDGVMRMELPPLNSSTQFYRLQSQPTP